MKVTIATGLYPPEIGGPAPYAAMLADELLKRDIEVNIVPFGWVRRYPRGIRSFVFAWKLWRESKDSDVIYALGAVSVGLPSVVVSKLRRVPFLIRLGGDYAWEQGRIRFGLTATLDEMYEERGTWPIGVRFLSKLQTSVAAKAERVIVPSRYFQSVVERWGIDPDRITVIYSALYPLEVNETRENLRNQLSYTDPTIVSAGRLVPWKGFTTVIDVVAELKKHFPQITLVIVGDGEDMNRLKAQVAKRGLIERVRFTGRISKAALGATIKAADVFVLNTAYEGLSHQLIEVMDVGTPIVTTRAGGNPELITDGVNGFLVEYNNREALEEAIARVLNHPESRERIVQSARGRSKEFSKERVILEIEQVLKNVYENNSS